MLVVMLQAGMCHFYDASIRLRWVLVSRSDFDLVKAALMQELDNCPGLGPCGIVLGEILGW
jgi:hypothetical protein